MFLNIFEAPSFFDSNFHPHSNETNASWEAQAEVDAYQHPSMHISDYYEDPKIPVYCNKYRKPLYGIVGLACLFAYNFDIKLVVIRYPNIFIKSYGKKEGAFICLYLHPKCLIKIILSIEI